jgi:cytochrome c oxidase assembly factor CtaG
MALIFSRSPWYEGFYGDRARDYGLTPLEDQQLGGALMMSLDVLMIVFALCLFFWKTAADHDREEEAQARRLVPD